MLWVYDLNLILTAAVGDAYLPRYWHSDIWRHGSNDALANSSCYVDTCRGVTFSRSNTSCLLSQVGSDKRTDPYRGPRRTVVLSAVFCIPHNAASYSQTGMCTKATRYELNALGKIRPGEI